MVHDKRVFRALQLACLLFCAAAILSRVWVAEDAYITFRVVENLFAGNGPVFNPGQRVEAFTHPLWFLCLVVLKGAGFGLHLGAIAMGLCLSIGGIAALIYDGRRTGTIIAAPALCALSGFRDFATAGMEFSLVFALLVCLDRLLDAQPLRRRPGAIATVLSLLYLARPELLLGGVIYSLILAIDVLRPGPQYASFRHRVRTIVRWCLPLLLLVGGWHAFRWAYFADLFPNTYYAKSGADSYTFQGLKYLGHTLWHGPSIWLSLGLLALFAAAHRARILVKPDRWLSATRDLIFPAALVAYWVRAGGDFMSFRVLLPPIVIFVLLARRMLSDLPAREGRRQGLAAAFGSPRVGFILLAGFVLTSFIPAPFAQGYIADERQVFTRDLKGGLRSAILSPEEQPWGGRGEALRSLRQCLQLSELRITNSQASARCLRGVGLGYFGVAAGPGVTILDEQGLPNREVALQPVVERFRPGHEHFVSLADALAYGAAFCSSGEPTYDRIMATPAGILITLQPEILLTLPNIEKRLSELRRWKQMGSNFIPRLEQRYGTSIEQLQTEAARHRTDAFTRSQRGCWAAFPGGPQTFFY